MVNNYPHVPVQIDQSMLGMKQEFIDKSIQDYQKKEQYGIDFYGQQTSYLPAHLRSIGKEQYAEIWQVAQKQLKELIGLPFWWNIPKEEHEKLRQEKIQKYGKPLCCFCHAVGLPRKRFQEVPLFPAEIEVIKSYKQYDRIFERKPRGFGGTTLNNYYWGWFCINYGFKYNAYRIIYVSGIGHSAAVDMIFRLKQIFMRNYPELILSYYNTDEKQVINGVLFEAFAGNNVNALRHYDNILALIVDEADHLRRSEERELLGVISSHEEKSKAKIILLSTPKLPDGLFYNIEFETSEDYKGWHKLLYDYNDGMNYIFDPEFIEREKKKHYFRREYMGKYEGNVGTMFPTAWVEAAEYLAEVFPNWKTNSVIPYLVHFIGIDPAWGASKMASKFSITVTRYNPQARYPTIKAPADYYERLGVTEKSDYNINFNLDLAEVIHFEQMKTPNIKDAVEKCVSLYEKYGKRNVYFMVDGSAIPFVESLKIAIHESPNYLQLDPKFWNPSEGFRVVPVLPNAENNTRMRKNLWAFLSARMYSLPKEFRAISIGIGSATGKEFVLDKDESPENDALDSACLSLLKIYTKEHDKRIYYS